MTARDVITYAIWRYEREIAGSPPADWSEWSERDPETAAIYQTHAGCVLTALDAAGLPVVPREATTAMCIAAANRDDSNDRDVDPYGLYHSVYAAMVAAAQETKE